MLFVACLPLLFTTLSLRWAINEVRLYDYGFAKYRVAASTGLSEAQLTGVARDMISYFNSSGTSLSTIVLLDGRERPLFNGRELTHMADVKDLIQSVYTVQGITLAWVVVYGGLSLLSGGASRRRWFKDVLWGSGLTLVLLVALGIGSLVFFDWLFLQFHLLSFANDFWMLDPARDYLIRMFPQGFFFDATLLVSGATVLLALGSGGIAIAYLRRTGKSRRTRRRDR